MRASARERPRVDHPVDRPELYGPRGLQVTGTNGQQLDHFYRSSSQRPRKRDLFDDGSRKQWFNLEAPIEQKREKRLV